MSAREKWHGSFLRQSLLEEKVLVPCNSEQGTSSNSQEKTYSSRTSKLINSFGKMMQPQEEFNICKLKLQKKHCLWPSSLEAFSNNTP